MKLKILAGVVFSFLFSVGVVAQQDDGGIKQDTRNAAHSTADVTKKTGKKVAHGTKKAVHKGAQETEKGAGKVTDKTQPKPTPPPQ
jgi:hypothetical protein